MTHALDDKWQLEGKGAHGEPWITPISGPLFRVGRKDDCGLRLSSDSISRWHAELHIHREGLSIRDCGSTNGTFVNFQRIADWQPLKPGDIIHFAALEFRVGKAEAGEDRTIMANPYVEKLNELIANRAVVPHFQPIIHLADETIVGYELLGRVQGEGMFNNIPQLFYIAKQLGREIELSLLFRNSGIAKAMAADLKGLIFFNTVPGEMSLDTLEDSLEQLRNSAPTLELAMEIHENAITDIGMMARLRGILNRLAIKLVYDDFGAGQSRLLELMDAPPDILKFDIALVRKIHLRSASSLNMVASLVRAARDLGVVVLAEGIELPEEAAVCRQIGFDLAQGYLFGKPTPHLPVNP